MKVKLESRRRIGGKYRNKGELVQVSMPHARRLIRAGFAVPAPERASTTTENEESRE